VAALFGYSKREGFYVSAIFGGGPAAKLEDPTLGALGGSGMWLKESTLSTRGDNYRDLTDVYVGDVSVGAVGAGGFRQNDGTAGGFGYLSAGASNLKIAPWMQAALKDVHGELFAGAGFSWEPAEPGK
jgi:hypothetical protein